MSNIQETNIPSNSATNPNPEDVVMGGVPTELEQDKMMVQEQQRWVDQTRQDVRNIFLGKTPECQLPGAAEMKQERIQRATKLKRSFLLVHPHESVFGGALPAATSGTEKDALPTRMAKELPGFRFKFDSEPIAIKRELIHTDVGTFLAHFEKVFSIHHVDIERHYQQPLSWCLSETMLNHYQTKQAAMEEGQKETWSMAKDWLSSFVETPANLIVNVQSLFNIRHQRNESSTAYFARVREARKKVRDEKISFDQLVAMVSITSTPQDWQQLFQKEMQVDVRKGHHGTSHETGVRHCAGQEALRRNDAKRSQEDLSHYNSLQDEPSRVLRVRT